MRRALSKEQDPRALLRFCAESFSGIIDVREARTYLIKRLITHSANSIFNSQKLRLFSVDLRQF